MNQNEEVPDNLGGLGDLLPADVLKKVNELLEQLHRKGKDHQGSTVINIYAPGSQHVDNQYIFGDKVPGKFTAPDRDGESLPEALRTEKAMAFWQKAQEAGYVDDMHTHGYQQNVWINCTNPMLSLSVSKDFFKRRLNIKLSGNDLFNGGINRITLYSNRIMFRKMEDNDSRCVSLSLRYHFNVTPSKYKGTGAGNAEKNRL